ncbi:MAG TPA: DUF1858 domain-containing protein [Planctomycetota bacterium]|jgi:hypothetical protein
MLAPSEPVRLSAETMLSDLLKVHPEARPVFDRYGLRGCGGQHGPVETLRFFARSHGVEEARLLRELSEQIASPAPMNAGAVLATPALADAIYRRYLLAGIAVVLTAGATWGAYILWQIGFRGSFTGASINAINAHGHAQIYGWVGLFVMGFSLQAFPRLWHTDLWRPTLAVAAFLLMISGIAVRSIGMILPDVAWALPISMAGAGAELVSVALYCGILLMTFLRGEARANWRTQPYLGFAFSSLFYFFASGCLDLFHTYHTLAAVTRAELLWYVATYQAPLRDLQVHGLAMCMILGVSIRMLPALFEVPELSTRRGWWACGILNASIIGETLIFVAYRWTNNHVLAALLLLPWIGLLTSASMIALPWKLWRPFSVADRSGKFVRMAYLWLTISLVMLLLLPVYQTFSGIPFSHAYYGAIRHAITVGFVSLMIMGLGAKVVATLNGLDPRRLSSLFIPFALVNLGCFLRVSLQTLTDWHPAFFSFVGISGVLEVTGLTIWGIALVRIMLAGAAENEAASTSAKPARILPEHRVADVLAWFPQTEDVFYQFGFTLLKQPILRRTLARQVSLGQACSLRNVPLASLLEALNRAAGCTPPEPTEAEARPFELPAAEENCSTCADHQRCHV